MKKHRQSKHPSSPSSGVTKENFARIEVGMTKSQVEAILGKPTAKSAHDNCSAWGDPNKEIADLAVWYDDQGRVGLKAWLRPE